MAAGTVTVFDQFKQDAFKGLHNIAAGGNTLKFGLVTATANPAETDSDPCWGAGGSTNYLTNEVTPGGNYSTGGPTISGQTLTGTAPVTFDDTGNIAISQNGSNPTNARYAIMWNDTNAKDSAILTVDLGATIDLSLGDFTVTWNGSGIFTVA